MHTYSQASLRPAAPSTWISSPAIAPQLHGRVEPPREPGTAVTIKRGETLFSEGDDADFFYRLVKGGLRLCRILGDGERQICDFILSGDLLGFAAGESYDVSAEAIEDCRLVRYRRSNIAAMIRQNAAFGVEIQELTASGLQGAYAHMVRLCRRSAVERIAWFLVALAKRSANDNVLDLPMSRVDIADYLGMAHETVSRVFTHLKKTGAIAEININRIKILKLTAEAV